MRWDEYHYKKKAYFDGICMFLIEIVTESDPLKKSMVKIDFTTNLLEIMTEIFWRTISLSKTNSMDILTELKARQNCFWRTLWQTK